MRAFMLFVLLSSLPGVSSAGMMGGGMGGMMGSQPSPPPPPAKNAEPQVRKGYKLVRTYCIQCHQAPNPRQHTSAEWPVVMVRMQGYMQQQHRPLPTNADRKLILDYLGAAK